MNKHDKFDMEIGRTIILASQSLLNERKKLLKKIANLENFALDVGYLTWAQVRDNTTEEVYVNGFESKLYCLVQKGRELSANFKKH